ncbi:unnamed protein product [Parajaminaea phylloscopi]
MSRRRTWLLQPQFDLARPIPWSLVFGVLTLVRLSGAAWSLISDCDETFNYWEALHLVLFASDKGASRSLQTWEYSPQYAIRSWAYILVHAAFAYPLKLLGAPKISIFYVTRCALAMASAAIETRFVRATSRVVNPRCAWILFLLLASNAGLWSASVALLPSTFTFYSTTLAMSFALEPARTTSMPASALMWAATSNRTLKAVAAFALGGLLGWPFALVLALPFVLEELCVPSGDSVPAAKIGTLVRHRVSGLVRAGLISALIAVPILVIDTLFYGRLTLVPWNIVVYNILSSKRGAGPELYGVEPPWFYLANLALNAGPIILALALGTAPLLLVAGLAQDSRISSAARPSKGHSSSRESSKLTLLLFRTAPWYLWLGLLSSQAHKEERFMFPAASLMCFNAAVSLEVVAGWLDRLPQTPTPGKSKPGRQGQTPSFGSIAALLLLCGSALFALLRITGSLWSYSAPFTVMHHLYDSSQALRPRFDLEHERSVRPRELAVCFGKEWHRFPNSFFLPTGSSIYFIKSEFDGILPKHFADGGEHRGTDDAVAAFLSTSLDWIASPALLAATRAKQAGFNDLNQEEWDRYVDPATQCHVLIDSDLNAQATDSVPPLHEPRFVRDSQDWQQDLCVPFLDSEASKRTSSSDSEGKASRLVQKVLRTVARILWTPPSIRQRVGLHFKDFCLLSNRRLTWDGMAEHD